jgi:hypothetical protein
VAAATSLAVNALLLLLLLLLMCVHRSHFALAIDTLQNCLGGAGIFTALKTGSGHSSRIHALLLLLCRLAGRTLPWPSVLSRTA